MPPRPCLSAELRPLLPQHTPLGAPGLYIQTLLPGSPAAADGRLSLGDRILEVNGSSLAGVGYLRYQRTQGGSHGRACARGGRSHPLQGRDVQPQGPGPPPEGWAAQAGPGPAPRAPGGSRPPRTSRLAVTLRSRAVDLIRHGGRKMRFLVAKCDADTAQKIRFRSPPP